jgi:hypothetical protein
VKLQIIACLIVCSGLGAVAARAQQPLDSLTAPVDTAAVAPTAETAPTATAAPTSPPPAEPTSTKPPLRERLYYGGSVIVTFGDVTRIGVYPMVAYKFTPKLSLGVEVGYEWLDYDDFDQTANNYGGSVFARYRIVPRLYAHAEYQMVNYEIFTSPVTSEREWIPYLLLGGGYAQPMGRNAWSYVEVLFDVLNDSHSPYEEGEPFISVGVGVGF